MNEVNERGNIIGNEDCDILTGEAREALEYNITCCQECYRYETCINAIVLKKQTAVNQMSDSMEWIYTKDKLPNTSNTVLVCIKRYSYVHVTTSWYDDVMKFWVGIGNEEPYAWMPIPTPPVVN